MDNKNTLTHTRPGSPKTTPPAHPRAAPTGAIPNAPPERRRRHRSGNIFPHGVQAPPGHHEGRGRRRPSLRVSGPGTASCPCRVQRRRRRRRLSASDSADGGKGSGAGVGLEWAPRGLLEISLEGCHVKHVCIAVAVCCSFCRLYERRVGGST